MMTSQYGPGHSYQSLKGANFFCVLCSKLPRRLRWFSLFKEPTSTLLQRLKDVALIQVLVVTSLGRVKLISLTQVPVGTSLRRLKLVGFIYIPVRRHRDVSNRSVSMTYQLRRLSKVRDVSTYMRPKRDVAMTSHAGWVRTVTF